MKKLIFLLLIIIYNSSIAQPLDDLIKIALENNPGLKSKYIEFQMSLEKIPQVNSLPDPNLSLSYAVAPIETRLGPQISKLSLSQMIPWFGTLKAQEDEASLIAKSKFQDYLNYRNKLIYDVTAAFYPIVELNKLIEIEKENIEILKSYYDIVLAKYENSESRMTDILRIEMKLNDSKTRLNILNKKRKPLMTILNKLLNRDEKTPLDVKTELKFEKISNDYRRDSLLYDNPILSTLDFKIKAANMKQTVESKKGLPKIGVGLDYILVGDRSNFNDPDNGKDAFMPMISLSIPIYRDKYNSAVKEAELLEENYKEKKNDVINDLLAQYDKTFYEIQLNEENIELYRKQIDETQKTLNLLYTEYSNSGKEFEEVLRMQQQLLMYKRLLVTSLSNHLILISKIDYLTAKN